MKDAYAIMRKTELYVVISKVAFIQNDALDEPNYFPELEILKFAQKELSRYVLEVSPSKERCATRGKKGLLSSSYVVNFSHFCSSTLKNQSNCIIFG